VRRGRAAEPLPALCEARQADLQAEALKLLLAAEDRDGGGAAPRCGCAWAARLGPRLREALDALHAGRASRLWPEIADPTPAELAAMPHGIDCERLTVHDLGAAFACEFHRRRRWCRGNCQGVFSVEPIRHEGVGPNTGRRFRFSDRGDAALFRLCRC
jgi:hypothetical protein